MKVYIVSKGYTYEGGYILGVFTTEELALEKFREVLAERRRENQELYEWRLANRWEAASDEDIREYAEECLDERLEVDDHSETYTFHSGYIELRTWEAL
jgi:hypothetical protein